MTPRRGIFTAARARPRAKNQANARATFPPHRRHSNQCVSHPGDGCGGRIRVRHVRHRRRIPDDAAIDLRRDLACGRRRLGVQPHGGIVFLRRIILLAQARDRSGAVDSSALRRRHRHRAGRLDFRAAAIGRAARPHHRAVLRGAADCRRHPDVPRRVARHPARKARQPGHHPARAGSGLDTRPAAEDALQALQDLSLRDPGGRCRAAGRIPRRHHGHRRQLPADPDHDLCPAGAHRDRDRHLDGADTGDDGGRNHSARRDQSSCRRGAGSGADGGRRDRRTIRRARGAANPQRTFAPAAWASDSVGRHPLCGRTGDPAE